MTTVAVASSSAAPPAPDLSSCSPQELSSWLLLSSRFRGDEMAVTTFLLETVSSLPNAHAISEQLVRESEGVPSSSSPPRPPTPASPSRANTNQGHGVPDGELGARVRTGLGQEPLCVSLTNPRGRFEIEWYENGMAFAEAKDPTCRIAVQRGTVRRLVVFSKPEDLLRSKHRNLAGGAKKDSAASTITKSMVLLVFGHDSECFYKKKRIHQVCLQLPALPTGDGNQGKTDGASASGHAEMNAFVDCVIQRLDLDAPTQVVRAARDSTFVSHSEAGTSTTTSGMPFVNCYHGVNDGVVFPLPQGLLFVKPPLFVPVEAIHSIAVASRNSSGGRYIDLQVVVREAGTDGDEDGNTSIEFTNIHKDEAPGLNRYIQSLVNAADRHNESDRESQSSVEVEAEIHSSDDEDNDGGGGSSLPLKDTLTKGRDGRPPPRRAGVEARAAFRDQPNVSTADSDDDEEEDADFVATGKAHNSSEEESDSDDCDDDDNGGEQESNDEQGGSSSNHEDDATEDESTESEYEDTADTTGHSAEKSRKRPRRD